MNWTRMKYFAAMMLIGDGVLALLRPQRDALIWNVGPESWKALMSYLSDHPQITRAIGAGEIAAGLVLIACRSAAEQEDAAAMRTNN